MRRTWAALAAMAVTGATLTGCSINVSSGPPTVTKADLQKDITDRMDKAGEKPQSVTCKDDLKGEVGKNVICEVTISDTNQIDAIVTVTKVDGTTVSYDTAPALSKEQLEKAVERLWTGSQSSPAEKVTCESGLDGKKGAEAKCDVTAADADTKVTAVVTEVKGLLMSFDVNQA